MEKKRKKYTDAELASALELIEHGTSIYQASRQFNVPETTLRNKRDGIYDNDTCGVQPVLNIHEEKLVVDWVHYLGKCGFPVKKEQLLDTVAALVTNLKRPNPFKDGRPGKNWFQGFMKRHPTLTKRVPQNLPLSRNRITEESIRAWFERVRTYFEKHDLLQIFEDPRRIFNCDETAFFLCPKEKQVLVKRGSKRVYNRVANDEKECLTVLVTVSANGDIAPPMVLYPYKRDIPKNIKLSVPGWWGLGYTESGWMNMESFYEYITNVFYPWLCENEVTLPVALFLDGHTSHVSLPLTTFCKEKGIVLVALLPNATHVLQPLDVAVFRPVKRSWKDIVHDFRVRNDYKQLKRVDFAKEVEKCFDRCLKAETIRNGFKCSGIFPFDPENINYDKLLPQEKQPQENHSKTENSTDQKNESQNAVSADEDNWFRIKFEDRLSPDTLKKFKDAHGHWNGDQRYEKLFLFWWNIASGNRGYQENTNFEMGDTTLTNNVDQGNISEAVFDLELGPDGVLNLCSIENTRKQEQAALSTLTTDTKSTPLRMQLLRTTVPKSLATITADSVPEQYTLPLLSSARLKVTSPVENRHFRPETVSMSMCSPGMDLDKTIINETIPKYHNIMPPGCLGPSAEVQSLTEKIVSEKNMHFSTPQSSNCDSPQFSLSEVEDDTVSIFSNTKRKQDMLTELDQSPVSFQNDTQIVATPQKIAETPSPGNISKDIRIVPTPFKNVSTPFKQAFYFPKVEKNNPNMKKIMKKLTPTVATANEFIEHQKRKEKEKEDKEVLKQKRKIEALEKQKKKENMKRLKETQTLQKNKSSVKKERNILKKTVLPIQKPGSSHHVTPVKRRNFFDTDSDGSV